jgi:hypothetical protein
MRLITIVGDAVPRGGTYHAVAVYETSAGRRTKTVTIPGFTGTYRGFWDRQPFDEVLNIDEVPSWLLK